MPDAPTPNRTRLAAAAGLLGASAVAALLLGAGPAPSVLQLAGASSDDAADDISGNCDEAEHASDPGVRRHADRPTAHQHDGRRHHLDDGRRRRRRRPADEIRSLDAAGAGTVIYAVEGGSLRLVTGHAGQRLGVEVEQSAGREIELDFRSGTQRVQVNVEIEDGQVRERVRVRDDADDTDIRTEDGVVEDDNSGPGSAATTPSTTTATAAPAAATTPTTTTAAPADGGDDDSNDDDSSGSGRDHPEDD